MIRTLLRVAVATGGCLVVGQEAGVSPMKVRLVEWREAVEKETRGLREQYAQVLAKAEGELAAKRAYGAAAKVRSRNSRRSGMAGRDLTGFFTRFKRVWASISRRSLSRHTRGRGKIRPVDLNPPRTALP
jgi:hypothetical protein